MHPNLKFMVLEYARNNDLFQHMRFVGDGERFGRCEEPLARYYFHQMIAGLEHIHDRGFVHRDISLGNFVVDENWNIKFADFGLAALILGVDGSKLQRTNQGTRTFKAPEVQIAYPSYDGEKADIFSLGVVLFFIATASYPFESARPDDPIYKTIDD